MAFALHLGVALAHYLVDILHLRFGGLDEGEVRVVRVCSLVVMVN